MRGSALLVKWPLGIFPAGEVSGGPAPSGMNAREAHFPGRIDKNHRRALGIQAHLKEEGGVNHKGPGARGRGGEDFGPALGDPGVEERLQPGTLRRCVKDDGCDSAPINRSGRAIDLAMAAMTITNAVTPPLKNLPTNSWIVVRVVRNVIAVGDDAAKLSEDARNGGLARARSAGETDDWGGGSHRGIS